MLIIGWVAIQSPKQHNHRSWHMTSTRIATSLHLRAPDSSWDVPSRPSLAAVMISVRVENLDVNYVISIYFRNWKYPEEICLVHSYKFTCNGNFGEC